MPSSWQVTEEGLYFVRHCVCRRVGEPVDRRPGNTAIDAAVTTVEGGGGNEGMTGAGAGAAAVTAVQMTEGGFDGL